MYYITTTDTTNSYTTTTTTATTPRPSVAQEVERVDLQPGKLLFDPGSSQSVVVSLSETTLTLTAPDELAVALHG